MTLPSKTFAFVIGMVCVGVLSALIFWPSSEPTYQGRTVTEWLQDPGMNLSQKDSTCEQAILYYGTNAIPYMLRALRYQPPRICDSTNSLAQSILKLGFIQRPVIQRLDRALGSLKAFSILGPKAEVAIPELNQMIWTGKPFSQVMAAQALAFTGPKALPYLMSILTNAPSRARIAVARAFTDLGTNAYPAVPLLINCFQDTNEWLCGCAAMTLSRLRLDPERALPALLRTMADPRPLVSGAGNNAIKNWGVRARPVLLKTLTNADPILRSFATNALLQIDPNALPKVTP